ncbi:general transcription factor IIF subunit 2 [Thrips palmi]|uniref:General transcription factor IIF subunit 2 n=1 Tax=Thrips palmi TaxID=161013 RepID=A0A6P8YPE3_THRPL|nr:general transcription factor IIF subunit 2 [Thrips palmi]XP_034235971.1 general transcription factor IIF subunit 2 [Thrips palmi]XP_034235972.1 general transcription factor IIF subunit 2 [Thrips palmi]XP_034235973.1 general transcription factor IIF subunit 2 [Thrips palmi]XP_034235974.1 general transcription factor IIF subunit 2 [Thrips palmi]
MTSTPSSAPHADKELDLSNNSRGVWLVKVPKYISQKWDKAPGNIEVGKLRISKSVGQKAAVSLAMADSMLAPEAGQLPIPKDHRLDVQIVERQMLGVFSYSVPSNSDAVVPETEKLSLEGRVQQKLECRPYADKGYMRLKLETFRKAAEPTRKVQQLDRVVQNYKPVSNHKHNIEFEEKRKAEGKKARDDKNAVLDMMFAAFEKHQYYNIKDLVRITKQPVTYLKEILKEVCDYNIKNPHKNMWELKPEYRHYKDDQPPAEEKDDKSDSD